jgi:hypothetical protein
MAIDIAVCKITELLMSNISNLAMTFETQLDYIKIHSSMGYRDCGLMKSLLSISAPLPRNSVTLPRVYKRRLSQLLSPPSHSIILNEKAERNGLRKPPAG